MKNQREIAAFAISSLKMQKKKGREKAKIEEIEKSLKKNWERGKKWLGQVRKGKVFLLKDRKKLEEMGSF